MIEFCGLPLRHRVINASGCFDVIAARRVFGGALHGVSLLGLRVQDDHARARDGNPPPRLWEPPAG